MLAADLLAKFELPITTTRKPTKSQFLRLSAVFYGNPEANLYWYCCRFKSRRTKKSFLRLIGFDNHSGGVHILTR